MRRASSTSVGSKSKALVLPSRSRQRTMMTRCVSETERCRADGRTKETESGGIGQRHEVEGADPLGHPGGPKPLAESGCCLTDQFELTPRLRLGRDRRKVRDRRDLPGRRRDVRLPSRTPAVYAVGKRRVDILERGGQPENRDEALGALRLPSPQGGSGCFTGLLRALDCLGSLAGGQPINASNYDVESVRAAKLEGAQLPSTTGSSFTLLLTSKHLSYRPTCVRACREVPRWRRCSRTHVSAHCRRRSTSRRRRCRSWCPPTSTACSSRSGCTSTSLRHARSTGDSRRRCIRRRSPSPPPVMCPLPMTSIPTSRATCADPRWCRSRWR